MLVYLNIKILVSKSSVAIFKPLLISLLAALAMMAIWFTLSARLDDAITWFALIAALDIALLERWTRNKHRRTAFWIAPAATVLCCVASLWLITALSVRYAGGFSLLDSIKLMGIGLFQELLKLRLSATDWLILAFAPLLAYLLAKTGPINDHRQPL